MKTLKEKVQTMLVSAMKSKDKVTMDCLRSIMTALSYADKSGTNIDEMSILKTLAKQRRQSIEAYELAGKLESAEQEKTELNIIEMFLPKALSEEQIKNIICDMINKIENFDIKKMGIVMRAFNNQYPGQDGKVVSTIIKSYIK